MDSHSLEVLGFPRVREMLAGLCQTEMGRERALVLACSPGSASVKAELGRLDEVCSLGEEPPLTDVKDVRSLLGQLRAAGTLTGPELLLVRVALTGIRRNREFFQNQRAELAGIRLLVSGLVPQPQLENRIDDAVDESGELRDSATPELADIRRRLRRLRNGLVGKLERLAASNPQWFNGPPTIRGDRFVLPLLLEQRNRVPGVIHGSSGSGQTLFVEPLDMVGEGNELQELRDAEAEEVARILRQLSRQVAEAGPGLAAAMEAAAGLDLLVAKRRFALRLDCRRPGISEDGVIEVAKGRHPLLLQRKVKVVPLDFRFPDKAQVVLISGPNAGGKTVVLKTLGLFSLMLGAGMYLPAAEGTKLPVFSRVFADIGDEQNLDSDLSSFTAHVGRLKEILEKSDKGTLVLVDEIGSSTAPEEGAALAVAVLEQLRDAGARSVITTHFGALKLYAQDEPGMANAAMEWGRVESADGAVKTGPTYRLKMGFPGESSAFEIAAGAGMPARVIERARTRIGTEWLDMGAKLKSLDEELNRVRVARAAAETEQKKVNRVRQEYDAKLREVREEARLAREKLRLEEERFLRDKRREVENLVRRIKETGASHETVVAAKQEIAERLEQVEAAAVPDGPALPVVGPQELKPGDVVESHTFRRQGVVVETDGNRATVAFGQIKMELGVDDLGLVAPGDVKPAPEPVVEETFNFDRRLSVRGMTREEADDAVAKFLDEAQMTGALELTVVHGKGGGVLRRALWDMLRRDGRIEEYKLAEAAAGGSGVTVVKLKSKG